jgi:signal transduction histidine kinase
VLSDANTAWDVRVTLRRWCEEWNLSRIVIVNSAGYAVADSSIIGMGSLFASSVVTGALNNNDTNALSDDKSEIYAAVPIFDDRGMVSGAVLIVANIDTINFMLAEISEKRTLISVLLAIVVTVLVFFVSQLFIDPLKAIVVAVREFSEGRLRRRVDIVGHDELAELAEAFNNMSEKLETLETVRQEFVSNVSHELKTPITSMKILSDGLLANNSEEIDLYREFLTDINSEVNRMTQIINELLMLVRLDNSDGGGADSTLIFGELSVTAMADALLRRLRPLARAKDITLTYTETKSFIITADENKLFLVFSNLIENGVKYTMPGGVVSINVDGDHQNVFITVEDSGIGIAEGEISHIFDRFYRVDKTRARDTGGTGLGLSIAHKIIKLHDGSIKVFSKEGEGSSFVVRLPIKQ